MEGTGKPEYDKCVAISTEASIKKMMLPGAIAIVSPLIIGFIMGPEALGGFLAGATVSGVLMGMFQNNAGGAWDNAKKSFEKGVEINGEMYYKKSDPHKASVTGDTVGDPFKDTSGPSMNILIKLMSIVSLVVAPTIAQLHESKAVATETKIEKNIQISVMSNDTTQSETVITEGPNDGLIQALQADGLMPEGSVEIHFENGKLTINGKEVDATPYKSYLKGDKMDIKIDLKKVEK
jgi:K(+)-stimulated pyrophosphate-energized sodium pump